MDVYFQTQKMGDLSLTVIYLSLVVAYLENLETARVFSLSITPMQQTCLDQQLPDDRSRISQAGSRISGAESARIFTLSITPLRQKCLDQQLPDDHL